MAVRLIAALIGIIIGVSILILDNIYLYTAAMMFFSAVAVWELTRATKCGENKLLLWFCVVFAGLAPTVVIIDYLRFLRLPVYTAFIVGLALILLKFHKDIKFDKIAICGATASLIPVSLSCIILLRIYDFGSELGIFMILFTLFSAWFGDSGAYFAGTFLGKHKLCPGISPKKTVEGFVGGVITVGVVELITCIIFNSLIFENVQLNIPLMVGLSMAGGLAGVLGDLSASVIKRQYDVKDFGNIMPGHGGVLDRFDSVLFTAPFLYVALAALKEYVLIIPA